MRFYKQFILTLILLISCLATTAKTGSIPAKVYMFGFAASFNDSTVYFTEIQEIDVFLVNNRTRFLVNRDDYSYQFRDFLQQTGIEAYPTCVTFYSQNKNSLMRKFQKMQNRYVVKPKRKFKVRNIPENAFLFKTVAPD